MLHESVSDENEIAGNPTSECDRNRGGKMSARSKSLLAPDQGADERAFQEEGEHAFHRQRLSDDATGVFGKVRPVRSELKFHRDAGDDPDGKIQSENLRPKSNGLIVFFVTGPQGP